MDAWEGTTDVGFRQDLFKGLSIDLIENLFLNSLEVIGNSIVHFDCLMLLSLNESKCSSRDVVSKLK